MLQHVLVATDLSTRSDRAIARAAELAARFRARLTILHVIDEDLPAPLLADEASDAQTALAEIAQAVQETHGLRVEIVVRAGHPAGAIAALAEEEGADLVVMGAHRRRILADIFVGTTIERVIRSAKVPVLMANAASPAPHVAILAAIDFSDNSLHAVRTARALGLFEGARLTLLNAFTAPAKDMMLIAGVEERLVHGHVSEEALAARRELEAFRASLDLDPARVDLRIEEGAPESVVDGAIAETGADLLVIGTRGATGLDRVLMGSVADALLRTIEIDVLAVPPQRG